MVLLDAETGEWTRTLRGHSERVHALRFASESGLLASTSEDQTAIVWDAATGAAQDTLDLGDGEVQGLAFGADGDTLYTAGADRAVRVWDLVGGQRFLTEVRPPGEFGIGCGHPIARRDLHGARVRAGGGIRFFDSASGASTDLIGPRGGLFAGAFTRDASRFAGAREGRIWVWDPATGQEIADNLDHPGDFAAFDIAYTADGSRLVIADELGRPISSMRRPSTRSERPSRSAHGAAARAPGRTTGPGWLSPEIAIGHPRSPPRTSSSTGVTSGCASTWRPAAS